MIPGALFRGLILMPAGSGGRREIMAGWRIPRGPLGKNPKIGMSRGCRSDSPPAREKVTAARFRPKAAQSRPISANKRDKLRC
jgi:hypothetical protein